MSTEEDRETERFILTLLDPNESHPPWNDGLTKSWNALSKRPLPEIVAFIKEARMNGVHFRSEDDEAIAKKIHHFGTIS